MLSHWEEVYPIIQLQNDVWSKVCFDNLVDSFSLSLGLGVKGRGHPRVNSCFQQEGVPEIEYEPEVTIGYDIPR